MLTTLELKKLSLADLEKELIETEEALVKLNLGLQTRQSKSTAELNGLRKQRARINTFKRQLQLEGKEQVADKK